MVSRSYQASLEIFKSVEHNLPFFVDVFDEETFYICVGLIVIFTILAAFVLSRFINLKETDL